ncbi:MAG: hypothetical protein JWO62_1046 [Acidimicrobiaceae bacterium]|jgi:predicted NBD/HSP70 family sugar kinase|nr:hypothetical protein [Acidimicrobiaceae bacterium]
MIPQRADVGEVRRNNLEVVLRRLSKARTASRAEIAADTGLTRATVSRLIGELIELGLVRETGRVAGQLGRPGTGLELNGRHVLAVGTELNVDSVTAVVRDLSGAERARRRRAVDAAGLGPESSVSLLAELCEQTIDEALTGDRSAARLVGVGVAIPGVVDASQSIIIEAPNLHWKDVPLGAMVRKALPWIDAPIVVDNDANFAALAEFWSGPFAGTSNLVYIIGEVGIGGGILLGGKPLPGNGGRAGEVGHMCVDPNGPRCGCGRRGCWEALVGLNAFLRQLGTESDFHGPELRIRAVLERAKAGEQLVLDALDSLGTWIGLGAANIVNVLSPEIIILGGYFPYFAEWIMPSIHRAVRERVMVAREQPDRLVAMSTLRFQAAAIGAALHVIDRVLSNPVELASLGGMVDDCKAVVGA